jgi:hypothetical protein
MSQTHRALAMLALSLALVAATTAVAAAATPPTGIEDQHDRLLRNLNAAQAERTQAAVEQARSMERNLKVTPAESPAPSPGVDVVATLLVGLIGGLVGGAAAMLGWTATTHRRRPRAAAST